MATLYISPTGSGLKDGSSAANAGTLANLNTFITTAGGGGQVLLLADQGAYQQNTYLNITHGGTADASVTIRGVDSAGNSMAADIVGARAENWTPGQAEGTELFRLTGGASNLNFQDLSISNVGNGAFRAGSDLSNISISNVDAHNVTRFFEDYVSGSATTASVTGLTIQNVNIEGYSKGAIDLSYNSSNITIKDVVADSQGQNGGLFVVGVHLTNTVHDVTLDTVTMKNNNGNGTDGQYWNGDGFTTENGVYNITFKDTVSAGNTDAGYDLKSSNTTLINTVAIGNDENYRLWSNSITVTNGVSLDPTHSGGTGEVAHVWMADGAVATLNNFTFSDSGALATLFKMTQTGATLYLADTSIPDVYMPLIKLYNGSTVQVLQDGVPVLLGATPPPPPPVDHAPTDITITGGIIQENALGGTVVATLAAVDPDAGNTHTFTLSGAGADQFDIVGGSIVVKQGAVIDYEQHTGYGLTVTATDQDGLSVSKSLQIGVIDVVETGTKGNDVLTGGLGADHLAGGAGSDTYTVNADGDVVTELAGQGTDTVLASVASYTLGDNVENLTYIGTGDFVGWGNSVANVINAGAGNDTLHGGSGNDTINGGDGSDTIYGDNGRDVIHGGEGSDFIFGGNDADTIWGDNGDDQLAGGQGVDTLYGGDGNDYLDGGTEGDTMSGGAGDDIYIVDNKLDVIIENANEGVDTVRTAFSHTLADNVENLTLTGLNNIAGTGNALNNVIIGNDGNNTLSGGAGNDTLDGGKGKDTLIGGGGDDTYLFGRGSGQDTIDNSHTDSGKDVLHFNDGISAQDLWFRHDHNDLVINVVGTGDSVRLVGWYGDASHQVDHIELNDGTHIDAGQIQQVVDAMAHASAAAPTSINNLTAVAHDAVVAVVAASWH
jgi:Ca2+-binding RTX toxin-like protein